MPKSALSFYGSQIPRLEPETAAEFIAVAETARIDVFPDIGTVKQTQHPEVKCFLRCAVQFAE